MRPVIHPTACEGKCSCLRHSHGAFNLNGYPVVGRVARWEMTGQAKVCLKVSSSDESNHLGRNLEKTLKGMTWLPQVATEEEMDSLRALATQAGLVAYIVVSGDPSWHVSLSRHVIAIHDDLIDPLAPLTDFRVW